MTWMCCVLYLWVFQQVVLTYGQNSVGLLLSQGQHRFSDLFLDFKVFISCSIQERQGHLWRENTAQGQLSTKQ